MMKLYSSFALFLVGSLSIAGCSKTNESSAASAGDSTQSPAGSETRDPARATASIDPCAFLTKDELESALGYTLDAGKATEGEPSCRFVSSTGGTVTIALPTANVTEADFNSWRQMAGANAEAATGIGDAAYFWGPRLYVRVGTRTFTISLADKELTPGIRDALTKLGRLGASKLG